MKFCFLVVSVKQSQPPWETFNIIIIIKMVLFYLFIQYYAVLKKISKTFNIYTSCPEMVTGEKPPDKSPPVKS